MHKALKEQNIPGNIGTGITIRIGTNTNKLFEQLGKCDSYRYAEINYTLVHCDANDVAWLDIDVFIAKNVIDLPTEIESVRMWILQEAAPLQNFGSVHYIKPNRDLDTELALHLRLDVQRMILAKNFNTYLQTGILPTSYNGVKAAFATMYTNIITLHQLQINDLIYAVDFTTTNKVISLYQLWLDTSLLDGTVKGTDPIVQMIPEWNRLLDTFPYRKTSQKAQADSPTEPDFNDLVDNLAPCDNVTWEEMFHALFPRRWSDKPISRDELRKFNTALTTSCASPDIVLMMLDSICSSSESFGKATNVQRYWYYSSLYELINMAGMRSTIDKKFNTSTAKTLLQLSVQYAGERDRQLMLVCKEGVLGRSPRDIPSMELEDTIISHVFWELLNSPLVKP
jgi:hypothetical protein